MSIVSADERAVLDDLWQRLAGARAVMLTSTNLLSPVQPMRPFADPDECAIWFFAHRSSPFGQETGEGGMAHLVLMEGTTYADILGRLEISVSQTHLDRYWSAKISSSFPGGKEDPDLVMLRFTPQKGWVWSSTGRMLSVGLEIALAGLIGDLPGTPDVAQEVTFLPPASL